MFNFAKFFRNLFGWGKTPSTPDVPDVPPVVTPPQPTLRAIAVAVAGAPGSMVTLDGIINAEHTDAYGYVVARQTDASIITSTITVNADGFMPYRFPVTIPNDGLNYTIMVGGASGPQRIMLPSLTPAVVPLPAPKTYQQKCRVLSNFCNFFRNGEAMFTSSLFALSPSEQDAWIATETGTHYVCAIQTGYGSFIPSINFFEAGRMSDVVMSLEKIIRADKVPVLFLHSGDSYPGDEYFRNLCQWFKDHAAHLIKYLVTCIAWEPVNGGYSSNEFNRANKILAEIFGDDAVIAFHLSPERCAFSSHASAHYPQYHNDADENDPANGKELDDPWFDVNEPDVWFDRADGSVCGGRCDVFLYQSSVALPGAVDEFGQPKWWENTVQFAERFLPAGTPMPGAKGMKYRDRDGNVRERVGIAGVDGPDWFRQTPAGLVDRPERRRRPVACFFEVVAWGSIRKYHGMEWTTQVANEAQSFGLTSFGNGLPTN